MVLPHKQVKDENMTQHTPGPWHRNIKSPDARYAVIFAGRNTHVAVAKGHGELTPAEIEANLNLIAAAPELLEVLEIVLQQLGGELPKIDAIMQAAIKKAKGE